jgi:hypothetical protein
MWNRGICARLLQPTFPPHDLPQDIYRRFHSAVGRGETRGIGMSGTMFEKAVWQVRGALEATDNPMTYDMCAPVVRAVLEAIREPDEAIRQAIDDVDDPFTVPDWWRFIVDEILKGAK